MITFNNDDRNRLLNEISRLLKPGGSLLVVHAERLTGLMYSMKAVRPSIYMRPWRVGIACEVKPSAPVLRRPAVARSA